MLTVMNMPGPTPAGTVTCMLRIIGNGGGG
jgi:hypothetical protein